MPKLTRDLDDTFLTEAEGNTLYVNNKTDAYTVPAALIAQNATMASMAGSSTEAGHAQRADSSIQAGRLTNARTIKTDLASDDEKGFDGTTNILPGVTGVLPVSHGGTGETTLALVRSALGLGNTTGTLGIAYGGTGMTTNPSMITNLGTTAAANVFQTSPRPGVTGTLPVANGGTGQTSLQATRNAMGLGNTTGALPVANGGTGQTNLNNVTVGSATSASHATSANSATSAGYANSANYANSAGVATTSAKYATTAGSANSAGTATSAGSATSAGYANSAAVATTSAKYATTAGSATSAGFANEAKGLDDTFVNYGSTSTETSMERALDALGLTVGRVKVYSSRDVRLSSAWYTAHGKREKMGGSWVDETAPYTGGSLNRRYYANGHWYHWDKYVPVYTKDSGDPDNNTFKLNSAFISAVKLAMES